MKYRCPVQDILGDAARSGYGDFSAGAKVVDGARGHEGTRRDNSRGTFELREIDIRFEGVLFGNSLICLKAGENLVGVLTVNHHY